MFPYVTHQKNKNREEARVVLQETYSQSSWKIGCIIYKTKLCFSPYLGQHYYALTNDAHNHWSI